MSDSPEERAMATVAKANAMIAEIKRRLEDDEAALRSQGLNPDKVREHTEKSLTPEQRKQAQELIAKDMQDIEDEVAQAKVHLSQGDSTSKAKRPRSMV